MPEFGGLFEWNWDSPCLFPADAHWTVLRRLGFWGQNLTLHAIIARHIVHIKGNMIIFATEVSKIEKK